MKKCGAREQLHAIAAGKCAAQKPCLIASNLNFTSFQKSHRDSVQVMTSGVASCVVTPYIPDTLSPACWTRPPYRQRMPTNSSAQRSRVCLVGLGDPRGSNCAPPVEETLSSNTPSARTDPSSRLSVLGLVTPKVFITRYLFSYCSLVVSRRAVHCYTIAYLHIQYRPTYT